MHQRHLGGVGPPREHALAEEGAVQGDAVKATDQRPIPPALHRVRKAQLVELDVEVLDRMVDPGLGPSGPGLGEAWTTDRKAVSVRISKGSARTVRARRRETWKPSSGITPRRSGSIRKTRSSSRASAIGKTPRA